MEFYLLYIVRFLTPDVHISLEPERVVCLCTSCLSGGVRWALFPWGWMSLEHGLEKVALLSCFWFLFLLLCKYCSSIFLPIVWHLPLTELTLIWTNTTFPNSERLFATLRSLFSVLLYSFIMCALWRPLFNNGALKLELGTARRGRFESSRGNNVFVLFLFLLTPLKLL